MHAAHERRVIGRQIEVDRILAHPGEEPGVAERDLFHLLWSRQRREDDVAGLRDVARRVRPLRAGGQVTIGHLPPDVVHGELVTAADQVQRHAAAHRSEPDESHSHDGLLRGRASVKSCSIRFTARSQSNAVRTNS